MPGTWEVGSDLDGHFQYVQILIDQGLFVNKVS
jgi:hypothetical protein